MCEYCENGKPLVIGKTNDQGIAIQFPNKLVAYGYDVHGFGENGLIAKIKLCPMCGRKLIETESNIEMKLIIHAHAIIDWCGDAECSNCGAYINTTEPYCQHCGADLDEPIERRD